RSHPSGSARSRTPIPWVISPLGGCAAAAHLALSRENADPPAQRGAHRPATSAPGRGRDRARVRVLPAASPGARRRRRPAAHPLPHLRIDEGGLPSAAVRSTADHGVAMRPKLKEEGSPMESYVGLDVHSKRSVFVIEAEDGRVVARGDIPTTPAGFRQLRQQHELAAETPVALETGTVAAWEKLLAALATEPALRTYVAQHHALWRCAQEQIVALEETLAAQPATIAKVAARLQTVPGVGPIVSLTAVVVFSDVHRFP